MKISPKSVYAPEITVDSKSDMPLHLQLSAALRGRISKNRPNAGTQLLSERKLAAELNVDRATIHRAYKELLDSGVLTCLPGRRGVFISAAANEKTSPSFPCLGVILPTGFSEFCASASYRPMLLGGMIDRANAQGYSTMMIQPPPPDSSFERVAEWKNEVIGRLAGIIHLGSRGHYPDKPLEAILDDADIPQILISGYPHRPHIGAVVGDPRPGVLAAVGHLRENGHENVGILSTFENDHSVGLFEYEANSRYRRCLDSLRQSDLKVLDRWITLRAEEERYFHDWIGEVMSAPEQPTAFLCLEHGVAVQAIEELAALGFSVPEDISIISYDAMPPYLGNPEITSIQTPFHAIGVGAVDALVDSYENGFNDAKRIRLVPSSLVIRGTTGRKRGNFNRHQKGLCHARQV